MNEWGNETINKWTKEWLNDDWPTNYFSEGFFRWMTVIDDWISMYGTSYYKLQILDCHRWLNFNVWNKLL